jgi:hypothetical protein
MFNTQKESIDGQVSRVLEFVMDELDSLGRIALVQSLKEVDQHINKGFIPTAQFRGHMNQLSDILSTHKLLNEPEVFIKFEDCTFFMGVILIPDTENYCSNCRLVRQLKSNEDLTDLGIVEVSISHMSLTGKYNPNVQKYYTAKSYYDYHTRNL